MSLDDGLSKFLGGLYEAVHRPDEWQNAMTEVVRRSDSRMIVATTVDVRRADVADIRSYGPEDSSVETGLREYVEGMSAADPVFSWQQQNPGAGRVESAAVVPGPDYFNHEFVKWMRSRFGTNHWSVFFTPPVDDLSFVICFFAPTEGGRQSRHQLALQSLLFENLERAVRLAVRPPEFAADDSALIAVDAGGRPLSLSQRAEELLRTGDELLIRDGLLTARSAATATLLQSAIRAAIDPASDSRGRSLRIPRNSGKPDLFVIASPFPPSLDHLPVPAAAALVRLVELDKQPQHLSDHSHLFEFSSREIDIASALLEGHSTESLAATLGLSRNTVRNHLQALFRKTGTNRQADLIRILDRVARQ